MTDVEKALLLGAVLGGFVTYWVGKFVMMREYERWLREQGFRRR